MHICILYIVYYIGGGGGGGGHDTYKFIIRITSSGMITGRIRKGDEKERSRATKTITSIDKELRDDAAALQQVFNIPTLIDPL